MRIILFLALQAWITSGLNWTAPVLILAPGAICGLWIYTVELMRLDLEFGGRTLECRWSLNDLRRIWS